MVNRLYQNDKRIKELTRICTIILEIIYENDLKYEGKSNNLYPNRIHEIISDKGVKNNETGLQNKKNTIDGIKLLVRSALISEEKANKQKKILRLTESGVAICKLLWKTDKYMIAFTNLNKSAIERIFCLDSIRMFLNCDLSSLSGDTPELPSQIEEARMKLLNKGWKSHEILCYEIAYTTLADLKNICDINLIRILLSRYAFLVKQKTILENNIVVKILITYVITSMVEKKITNILNNFDKEFFGYSPTRFISAQPHNIIIQGNTDGFMDLFNNIYYIFSSGIVPMTIKEEVGEMIYRYLDLSEPSLANLDFYIDDLIKKKNSFIAKLKDPSISITGKKIYQLNIDSIDLFLDIYIKYCKEQNYEICPMP